jgi:hypothetical protein
VLLAQARAKKIVDRKSIVAAPRAHLYPASPL